MCRIGQVVVPFAALFVAYLNVSITLIFELKNMILIKKCFVWVF